MAVIVKDDSVQRIYILIIHSQYMIAGEAYDKTARLLGLDLNPSGGAALEKLAREGDPESYAFKEPMLNHRDCNLSYAGLKTSVRLSIERDVVGEPSEENRQVCLLGEIL